MMHKSAATLFIGLALGAQGARMSRHRHQADRVNAEESTKKEYYTVMAKEGVSTEELKQLCASIDACERTGHPSEGGMPFFKVHTDKTGLEELRAREEIEFIEADGEEELAPEQEDFDASDAPDTSAFWNLNRIGAPSRGSTGRGVHIYILDTGIRRTHSDFSGRASAAIDVADGGLVECGRLDTNCAIDRQGHGTHCAGSAGGRMFGVAPDARIHAVKVIGDDSRWSWSNVWTATDWIARSKERSSVASFSWDGDNNSVMRQAVDTMVRAGVTVVVAAGNRNADACNFSPAFVSTAITVGSITSSDEKSAFSNFGKCVDLWAPGSSIVSAGVASDSATRTLSGSSMAAPHVAGGAALVLQQDPGLRPDGVFMQLLQRAQKESIGGLSRDDNNDLLWVSASPAPQPTPKPCRRRLLCWY